MQIRLIIILLLLFGLACNVEREERSGLADHVTEAEITFDKTKWRIKDGSDYPYRDQMLDYIVYNKTVRTLKKDALLELLGEPDRSNEGYLYYMIAQKRLWLLPLHTKTLVIKLSKDSRIVWIKIHE